MESAARGESSGTSGEALGRRRTKQIQKTGLLSAEPRIAGCQSRGTYRWYAVVAIGVHARPRIDRATALVPSALCGCHRPGGLAEFVTRCRIAAPAPALQPRCWFLIAERSGTGRPDQRYCPLGSSRELLFGNTYLLAPPTVPGEKLQRARRWREVISPSSMYCSQLARCSSWGLLSVSLPSLGAGHACMYKACTKCKVEVRAAQC